MIARLPAPRSGMCGRSHHEMSDGAERVSRASVGAPHHRCVPGPAPRAADGDREPSGAAPGRGPHRRLLPRTRRPGSPGAARPPQQVGMAFSEDLTRVRLRRETRAWRSRRRPSPSSHPPATGDPGPGRDRPPHRADRRRQRRPGRQGPQHGLPAAPSGARPGLPSSADGRRRRHGPVFHQQRYASRHDETVMRAPRTWAARATTDETTPCAMTRGSDPVETHRRSRWYYGLSSAVDTGGRLLCNRFGHAPPE